MEYTMSRSKSPGDTIVRSYATEDDEAATTAVLEAVSLSSGVPLLELPPLSEAVDPDGLNALCRNQGTGARVEFDYAGQTVVVREDETIAVRRRG